MLVIRKQQLQEFIAGNAGEFAEVVRTAIRKSNEERVKVYDDKELDAMLAIGIARAKSHGLTGAEDIAAFVAVMFEIAPRFDEQPEIREVLQDANFKPDDRLEQLFIRVPDAAWAEASKKYDDSFWFPAKG